MKMLVVLVALLALQSCDSIGSKPVSISNNHAAASKNGAQVDSMGSEKISKDEQRDTFPGFVKKTEVPDSILIDSTRVFYGDFNADGKEDFAALVQNLRNDLWGVLIIHNTEQPEPIIMGAVNENDGIGNMNWVGYVSVIPQGKTIAPTLIDSVAGIIGPDKEKEFELIGEALKFGEREVCGGGILFWKGNRYEWFHVE